MVRHDYLCNFFMYDIMYYKFMPLLVLICLFSGEFPFPFDTIQFEVLLYGELNLFHLYKDVNLYYSVHLTRQNYSRHADYDFVLEFSLA